MLQRYFGNGDAPTPPPALLAIAAQILGVREEWLATGDGGMTQADELAVRTAGTSEAGRDGTERLFKAMEEEFPPLSRVSSLVRAALWSVWPDYVHARQTFRDEGVLELPGNPGDEYVWAARWIGRILRTTMEWAGGQPDQLSISRLEAFTLSMAQALRAVVPSFGLPEGVEIFEGLELPEMLDQRDMHRSAKLIDQMKDWQRFHETRYWPEPEPEEPDGEA